MSFKSMLAVIITRLLSAQALSIDNPVVSLFLGHDIPDIPYFASIISSLPGFTAYQVQCTPGNTITMTTTSSRNQLTITSTSTPKNTVTITSTNSPKGTRTITSTRSPGVSTSYSTEILTTSTPEVLTSILPAIVTSFVPSVLTNAGGIVTSVVPNVVTELIPQVVTSFIPDVVTNIIPAGVNGILGDLIPRQLPTIKISIPDVVSVGVGTSGIGLCLLGSCPTSVSSSLVPAVLSESSCPFTAAPPQITQSNDNTFIGTLPNRTFTCIVTSTSLGANCKENGFLPCGNTYSTAYRLPAASNLLKPVTITAGIPVLIASSPVSEPPMAYGGMPAPGSEALSPVMSTTAPVSVLPTVASIGPTSTTTEFTTTTCTTTTTSISTRPYLPVPLPIVQTQCPCAATEDIQPPSSTSCSTSTFQTLVSPSAMDTEISPSTITSTSTQSNIGATTTVVGPQITMGGNPFSGAEEMPTFTSTTVWIWLGSLSFAVLLL
jgi:hypothetical protein